MIRTAGLLLALTLASMNFAHPLVAQSAEARPSLNQQVAETLRHVSNGHSPTNDEIAAMRSLEPPPDAAAVADALPLLVKALSNPDGPVRTYALTAVAGLEAAPAAVAVPASTAGAESNNDEKPPVAPAAPIAEPIAYKPDVARVLAPAIPAFAKHLTDESLSDRLLAATILGGFTPDPPSAVYPPLLAFLKRDDAAGQVGVAVVGDLLQLGPISEETSAAIARFLRRSDQTADSRATIADLIASKQNQSQSLNKALLAYLDSDDPGLRARIILSLPQLDLAADVFADAKAHVVQIAGNDAESLQVVTAAKAVANCWTATRMTSGCPVY